MSAHSPGPWAVYGPIPSAKFGDEMYVVLAAPDGLEVARFIYTIGDDEAKETALANACLTAAAPELLAVLKVHVEACRCRFESPLVELHCALCRVNNAAIAAAEGRE